jgi:N-acetylglucosamine kinase-like BadF-type ATPase
VSTGGAGTRLLGVDGGASKTDAWIVDADGRLLGQARGAGSNHQLVGLEGAMDALGATVRAALEAAGDRTTQPVDIGVYCMAGVDFDVDEQKLGQAIATGGWSRTDVVRNDTMAVLRAGAQSGWGVGVVCGSGLNCVGLGPDGRVERFPSLAELSGDFTPGGAWLGVRALGLALRAGDGRGGPTALTDLVPAYFDRPDPESVLLGVYLGEIPYSRLFELARVCLDAADAGDHASVQAVTQLADEVAAMVIAILQRLGVEGEQPEVVLGGGLFDGDYAGFARRVEALVSAVAPAARYCRLGAPPVLGSALLALDVLGAPPDATARLRASAARPADNQHWGRS